MSDTGGPSRRIGLLDAVRGLAVLVMVLYHFLFDLVAFFGAPARLFDNLFLDVVHYTFAGVFIALAGLSSRLSRSNLRRGLKLALVALGISLVTWLLKMPVLFGILHFLAVSTLLYGLSHRVWERLPELFAPLLYLALAVVSMLLTQSLNPVQAGWLWPLGFYSRDFFSSDYFPLLPWFFIFLLGTWLGKLVREGRLPPWFYTLRLRPLAFVGRHALLIYVLHQPLLYGLGWLITGGGR